MKKYINGIIIGLSVIVLVSCGNAVSEEIDLGEEVLEDEFGVKTYVTTDKIIAELDEVSVEINNILLVPMNEYSEVGTIAVELDVTNNTGNDLKYYINRTNFKTDKKHNLGEDGIVRLINGQINNTLDEYVELEPEEYKSVMLKWTIAESEKDMEKMKNLDEFELGLVDIRGKEQIKLEYKLNQ